MPAIAGAHHEKIDGTGYPDNLRGASIPLGARIIAVADVFEALTSRRHYRDPMALPDVFEHLVNNSGVHFDRTCVDALIRFCETNDCGRPEMGAGSIPVASGAGIALPGIGTLH